MIQTKFSSDKYIFVGRSYGGQVAMHLAKKYLEQTKGLILISPAGSDMYVESPELYKLPLLLIWVKDDPIIKFEHSRVFEKYAQNLSKQYFEPFEFKTEPWRSHSAQEEKPEEVNEAILEFLTKIE